MNFSKPLILPSLILLLISLIVTPFLLKTPQFLKKTTINNMEEKEASENENGGTILESFGVKIEKNPPQSKLDALQVTSWPKWSGQPSKIPWTFEAQETMYLLEGKVKVSIKGHEGSFEVSGGDLIVFPKGMKIIWEVLEPVSKHYHLDK